MLLICLAMVLPRMAAWWSLCSSGSFAARYFKHDRTITAGTWHSLMIVQAGSMEPQLWAWVQLPCTHIGT